MSLSSEGKQLFLQAASSLGINLEAHVDEFEHFYALLVEANRRTNLTAIKTENEIIIKHFIDSLCCLKSGKFDGALAVIDVGSGAGFPGLPLRLARPNLQMTLLDATAKKVEFLQSVCLTLGLTDVECRWGRAEELGLQPGCREIYDRVVTRAVGHLSTLYELCLPLLKVGGFLIAQKGPDAATEVVQAGRAAQRLGGRLVRIMEFTLPVTDDPRCLVIVEKTSPTPDMYPRRPGVPQKNPLS